MKPIKHFSLTALLLSSPLAFAGTVADGDLVTFTANSTAKAAEVNQNFTALKNAVNDSASDITALEADVATNTSDITALQAIPVYTDSDAITAVSTYLSSIKQGSSSADLTVTSTSSATPTSISSLTVTPSQNGYVFVTASGRIGVNQTSIANNYGYVSISTSTTAYDGNYESFLALDTSTAGNVAERSWAPLHINRVQAVTANTPVTFAITAYRDNSGVNSVFCKGRLTAIFVPSLLP